MEFVHPQIRLTKRNFWPIFSSFLKSPNINFLEENLSLIFPQKRFVFTDMGRSAFRLIIEKLHLENSQILFPAYICDIFLPIFQRYNLNPVFVDIDLKTFNINLEKIKEKITSETKSIFVCHTYGLPTDIQKLREITNNQLLIIEDCAHSFGAKVNEIFAGNFGDVAFFSLYKQFPTMRGGLLVYPKDWGEISLPKTSFSFRDFFSFLNSFSSFAFLFKTFGQDISPKLIRKEKMTQPSGINSVSLNLLSYFFENFEEALKRKVELALFFQEELKKLGFEVQQGENNIFCYLSALMPENLKQKRNELLRKLRKQKIFCTRIWHRPIVFNPEVQKEYNLNLNEFPNTIEAAERIINFPLQNYYSKEDIEIVIKGIRQVLNSNQELGRIG